MADPTEQRDAAKRRDDALTREVTILLAQLRGFARGSEAYPASALIALLARCFNWVSDIVAHHGGVIDRAGGDSITVAFESRAAPHDGVRRAVACAADIQLALQEINALHRSSEMPEMHFGIGLNTGQVLSPLLAGDPHETYGLLGQEVDLASRIQAMALRGQVLMSESTYERCRDYVLAGGPIEAFVKGQSRLAQLRELMSIPALGKAVPRQDNRRSPRAGVSIPCIYRMVVNRAVVPEERPGRLLDIGYQGVLAEIGLPLSPQSEVELAFRLPPLEAAAALRGRIIKVVKHDRLYRAGIEFTGLTHELQGQIQLFVQRVIQEA